LRFTSDAAPALRGGRGVALCRETPAAAPAGAAIGRATIASRRPHEATGETFPGPVGAPAGDAAIGRRRGE